METQFTYGNTWRTSARFSSPGTVERKYLTLGTIFWGIGPIGGLFSFPKSTSQNFFAINAYLIFHIQMGPIIQMIVSAEYPHLLMKFSVFAILFVSFKD